MVFAHKKPENSVPGSLHKLLAVSNIYIHKISYTVTLLRWAI